MSDIMDTSYMGDDMQQCEGDGCEIMFTSNSHNQKYADPRCRKEQEYNIVCSHRRELNDFGVPNNPMDDLKITDEEDNITSPDISIVLDYENHSGYNR